MKPDFVVDVGNSRIKWGRCSDTEITDLASLPPDNPAAWQAQFRSWSVDPRKQWVVSGVAPTRRDALVVWLQRVHQQVHVLDSYKQLPLQVKVDAPEEVGIDRLLNAVAANGRRPANRAAVIIDAGSAVTVDWLDTRGVFCGGAIMPGLRTMALALHDYTARLPLADVSAACPPVPGANTAAAIEAGIFWSVIGGIEALIRQMTHGAGELPMIFLGGGDANLLSAALDPRAVVWPQMTLDGIRIAAGKLID